MVMNSNETQENNLKRINIIREEIRSKTLELNKLISNLSNITYKDDVETIVNDCIDLCNYYYVRNVITYSDLFSKKRNAEVSFCRQLAMYIIKNTTILTLSAIGKGIFNRHHSTVIHAVERIDDILGGFSSKKEKEFVTMVLHNYNLIKP